MEKVFFKEDFVKLVSSNVDLVLKCVDNSNNVKEGIDICVKYCVFKIEIFVLNGEEKILILVIYKEEVDNEKLIGKFMDFLVFKKFLYIIVVMSLILMFLGYYMLLLYLVSYVIKLLE